MTASPPIDPSVLLALAERCEREESSRELDAAILNAVGHQAIARKIALSGWEWRKNGIGIWSRMPWPTTSLDSAVTLVPEGWAWFVQWIGSPFTEGSVRLWIPAQRTQKLKIEDTDGVGKTPTLALCAAALRARAAIAELEVPIGSRISI